MALTLTSLTSSASLLEASHHHQKPLLMALMNTSAIAEDTSFIYDQMLAAPV